MKTEKKRKSQTIGGSVSVTITTKAFLLVYLCLESLIRCKLGKNLQKLRTIFKENSYNFVKEFSVLRKYAIQEMKVYAGG
jgi:hypothetical protein